MSRAEAKRALDALDEVVVEELENAQKGPDWRASSADSAGRAGAEEAQGGNPATWEEIEIAAKPAPVGRS